MASQIFACTNILLKIYLNSDFQQIYQKLSLRKLMKSKSQVISRNWLKQSHSQSKIKAKQQSNYIGLNHKNRIKISQDYKTKQLLTLQSQNAQTDIRRVIRKVTMLIQKMEEIMKKILQKQDAKQHLIDAKTSQALIIDNASSSLPRTIAVVGRKDPLYDDSLRLCEIMARSNIEYHCEMYKHFSHAFLSIDKIVSQCNKQFKVRQIFEKIDFMVIPQEQQFNLMILKIFQPFTLV